MLLCDHEPQEVREMLTTNQANGTKLLTVSEFAQEVHMTVAGVRRWLLEGRIARYKLGRLVRIPSTEVQRLLDTGFIPARKVSR